LPSKEVKSLILTGEEDKENKYFLANWSDAKHIGPFNRLKSASDILISFFTGNVSAEFVFHPVHRCLEISILPGRFFHKNRPLTRYYGLAGCRIRGQVINNELPDK